MKDKTIKIIEVIRRGAATEAEIAKAAKMSVSRVQQLLKEAKEKGLLTWDLVRNPNGRGRVRAFRISVAGHAACTDITFPKPPPQRQVADDYVDANKPVANKQLGTNFAIAHGSIALKLGAIAKIAGVEPGDVLQRLVAEEAEKPLEELVRRWCK